MCATLAGEHQALESKGKTYTRTKYRQAPETPSALPQPATLAVGWYSPTLATGLTRKTGSRERSGLSPQILWKRL
jgi:hypothetical protein